MSFRSFSKDIDNHHIGVKTMDQRVHQLEEDIKEAMGDSFKPQGEHTLGDILDRATASLKKDKKEPTPWTTTENLNRTMDELVASAEHLEFRARMLRGMADEISKW